MPLKDIFINIEAQKPTPLTGLGTPLFVLKDTADSPTGDVFGTYYDKAGFLADVNLSTETKSNAVLLAKIDTLLKQTNRPNKFCILTYATDAGTALNGVSEQDFYFVLSGDDETESKTAITTFVDEKDFRLAAVQSKTTAELSTYITKHRVISFYNPTDGEHLDVAAVGNVGSLTVGSVTWKFKSVVGVTPTKLSQAEMTTIDNAHAIAYTTKYGYNELTEGWTSYVMQGVDGYPEYIDDIHGQDWIKVDMEAELAKLLYNTPKLPYDQRGISALEAAATTSLQRGFTNGIVGVTVDNLPNYTVTALPKETQTESDILNRKYRGIQWTYGKSGAIHEVYVSGTITY